MACLLGQVSLKKKKLEGRKEMEEDKSSGTLSRNEMKELNDLMVDFNERVKTAKCTYFSTSVLISITQELFLSLNYIMIGSEEFLQFPFTGRKLASNPKQ